MLGRVIRLSTLVAVLGLTVPATAQAQPILYFGGAVFTGTGDFGDFTDAGFAGLAGLLFPVSDSPVSVGGEGLIGSFGGVSEGPSVTVYSVMAIVDVTFGTEGSARPYVFAGAGMLGFDVDTGTTGIDGSETKFGYQGGAGLAIPTSDRVSIWFEGRYLGSEDVKAFGAGAGLGIALGS